ncbi:hypothetical protein LVJ94_31290 [Pendulispora rubella]|uniref:Uncharacterized protein n=1 Tax=Pendulispora rubella TaxID=2741070 RepID=A0ABZ2KRV8_9BACT
MPVTSGEVDGLILQAITERRLMQLKLNGLVRIVEPHDYGLKKGEAQLLAYQIGGQSSSGGLPEWRWLKVDKMSDVSLLEATFPGGREIPSGIHQGWDVLFLRVADSSKKDD